jgi:hypothetical protein
VRGKRREKTQRRKKRDKKRKKKKQREEKSEKRERIKFEGTQQRTHTGVSLGVSLARINKKFTFSHQKIFNLWPCVLPCIVVY